MERTNFNRSIYQSFILDEEKVKSLFGILKNRVGEPSISAVCVDDADRHFESVDKLLEYENARKRRIISLSLCSRVKEWTQKENRTIDITYYINAPGNSYISVRVQGTEEWASITMQQLVEVIKGSRPWYSRISRIDEFIFMWPFAVILYLLLIRSGVISPPLRFTETFAVLGLSFVPAWGMKYVIRHLFPSGVYLIGQEKARYRTKEKMRWVVISVMFPTVWWAVDAIIRLLG